MMSILNQTLSQASAEFLKRGFNNSYKYVDGNLQSIESEKIYDPDDMEIVEFHRFEGDSNPADMSIIFAVKCKDGTKGTIISSYGAYADEKLDDFMKKVKINDRTKT